MGVVSNERTDEGHKILGYVKALTKHHHEMTGIDIGVRLVRVFSAPDSLRDRIRITRRVWKELR